MSDLSRMPLSVLAVVLAAYLPATAMAAEGFEEPPQKFKAAQFLPAELMSGEGFTVEPEATNDGFTNSYDLTTDWGEVTAISDYRLRVRLQEIQALKTLDSMSRAGQFGEGLKNGVLSPVEGAYSVVTSPIETTSGAVKGVGRWFGNVASSVTSDDPHQEGALSAAAGWAGTKRAFAVELGVDPYTDWEPLQEALVSVGRAAFAGGITASVAMGVATQDTVLEYPILALSLTNEMNQVLIDNPPERLTEINKEKLLEIGIDEDLVESFLRNYNYSPLEKLLLVEALHRMTEAEGRQIFLTAAAGAPDKVVARYFQQRAEMMANYHTKVAATDIVEVAELPIQKTREGRLVGVFPLDYLLWSAEAAAIVTAASEYVAQSSDIQSSQFWFEGSVSPKARAGLEAQGWTVKEQAGMLIGEAPQGEDGAGTASPAARGAAKAIPN